MLKSLLEWRHSVRYYPRTMNVTEENVLQSYATLNFLKLSLGGQEKAWAWERNWNNINSLALGLIL